MEPNSIAPRHAQSRERLRTLGPKLLVIGAVLMGIGMLFTFSGIAPIMFLLCFIGMPLGFAGLVMTLFGYLGALTRYQAQEIAPVANDTFNYVADGTQTGVETVARAIKHGFSNADADVQSGEKCPSCGKANRHDAKFCDQCGAVLEKICPLCGKENEADAKFCNGCGGVII